LPILDENSQLQQILYVTKTALEKIGLSSKFFEHQKDNPGLMTFTLCTIACTYALLDRALPVIQEHSSPEYLEEFKKNMLKIAQAVQVTLNYPKPQFRPPKKPGIPKMYRLQNQEIFMNLPNTPLGEGTFGKVKKSVRITAKNPEDMLVAKKVLRKPVFSATDPEELKKQQYHASWAEYDFKKEQEILAKLAGKRGIICFTAQGNFGKKSAIFFPLYDCSLRTRKDQNFILYYSDVPKIMSQLLDGLCSVAEQGIHSDLAPRNILLRRKQDAQIEAVIADFGAFQYHVTEKCAASSWERLPPEYYKHEILSPKLDVWALGLVFYSLCCDKPFAPFSLKNKEEMATWSAGLEPGWILKESRPKPFLPEFIIPTINEMLDPREEYRPTAKEVHEFFKKNFARWVEEETEGRRTQWEKAKMLPPSFEPAPLEPLWTKVEAASPMPQVLCLEACQNSPLIPLKKKRRKIGSSLQ
jgi:serine/threonine protein kinase